VLSHFCPKNISVAPEKTAMLTCKIALPDSCHAVIISKNPADFGQFISLHGMNFVFFRLIDTNKYFFHFSYWLLPEKNSFCPQNNGFGQIGRL